ncbi:MAG TPA: hypothetical protein VFU47_03285, partial [Armatimonadota bacterium]|nr:hypothetical protein [Armatimonadota bacterium]
MRHLAGRVGLLSAAGVLALALAAGSQPANTGVPQPPVDLALIGVTSIGDRSQAWLVDLRTRERKTVDLGDEAFGYRVKRVQPEQVVLSRGGRDYVLRLGQKRVPTVAAAVPGHPQPKVRVENAAGAPVSPPPSRLEVVPAEPQVPAPEPVPEPAEAMTPVPPAPEEPPPYYPGYGVPGYGALGYRFIPGYGMVPDYGSPGEPP